jgi:hypothetical protein
MRLTVSEIDAFRYWKASEYDPDGKQLIAQLRKQVPPTPEMLAGIAFHNALETARQGEYESLRSDGYEFQIRTGLEVALPTLREVTFPSKVYCVDGLNVDVRGRVDAIHGNRIDDHKTTGEFKADKYFAGSQWRLYLDMAGADHFRWNIFVIEEMARKIADGCCNLCGVEIGDCECIPGKVFLVTEQHTLDQYRYPSMVDDIITLLGEFVDFIKVHLPERMES